MKKYIVSIAIETPSELSKIITNAQRRLGVGRPSYRPHITLFLFRSTPSRYKAFLNQLREKFLRGLVITIGSVRVRRNDETGDAFLFLEIKKSKDLQKLHKAVVMHSNRFRTGMLMQKRDARSTPYSRKELDYIKRYGYQRIFELFNPHITLGNVPWETRQIVHKKCVGALKRLRGKKFHAREMVVGLYTRLQSGTYKAISETTIPITEWTPR